MADLTSTITIAGTIAGRKIEFSHTYTIEDVYDAGVRLSGTSNESMGYVGQQNSGPIGWLQDTPNYIMVRNTNTQFWHVVEMPMDSVTMSLCLAPGQTSIIHGTTGVGNLTNATGSTVLQNVTTFNSQVMTGQSHGTPIVFVAFNAST